jgi:hypothetical protein
MAEEVFLMKQGFTYRDAEDMPSWERKKYVAFIQEVIEKAKQEIDNGR